MAAALIRLAPFALVATASPSLHGKRAVSPVVKDSVVYGVMNQGGLNRDSCVSTAWNGNVLWTCRDTQPFNSAGEPTLPVIANTASYSVVPSASQAGVLNLTSPQGFGPLFYPFGADECPSNYGACTDGTRWVGWPDAPPLVTFAYGGAVSAWAFINHQHLQGLTDLGAASYNLYQVTSQAGSGGAIPVASLNTENFWSTTEIGYGEATGVVRDSYAYLYGPTNSGNLAVARVSLTGFLGTLSDKTLYEYYACETWFNGTTPTRDNACAGIPNLNSKVQSTIYWSQKWQSYVWIGSDGSLGPDFQISTSPSPEGPWTTPTTFYTGGSYGNGYSYTLVAHPGLTDGTGNYIFISWTTFNTDAAGNNVYYQPLVRIDWK